LKLLLDHNIPRRFGQMLQGHQVKTTREMRWETLRNGVLLEMAATADFNAFISTDKKLEFEQNLRKLPLSVIVLDALTNSFEGTELFGPFIQQLLVKPLQKVLYIVEPTGNVLELTEPRQK
jgi:hypothetical protein